MEGRSGTKRHSTKKLDLTGCRFGALTAVAPAENIGSRTAWLCRCDCGKEHVATTRHLRGGHVTSCGCKVADGGPAGCLTFVDGTCVEMLRKNTVRRNNTSGIPGVEWNKQHACWRVSICFQGRRYYLGTYREFDEAVAARKRAERETHEAFLEAWTAGTYRSGAMAGPNRAAYIEAGTGKERSV